MSRNWSFTSESVTEGHPDKMADQISDAILDALLLEDPNSRVACETMVTTGLCVVSGEITTSGYVDIPDIVRETIREIGYNREDYGFDGSTCGVMVTLDSQSDDISQGVDNSEEIRSGNSEEGLARALSPFFELEERKELPFVIREHRRKFQFSMSLGSRWRRLGS